MYQTSKNRYAAYNSADRTIQEVNSYFAEQRYQKRLSILGWLVCAFVIATAFDALDMTFLVGAGNTLSAGIGMSLAAMFFFVKGPRLFVKGPEIKGFLIFLFAALFTEAYRYATLPAWEAGRSFRLFFSYFQVFIMFLLVQDITLDRRIWKRVLNGYVLTYVCFAILALAGFGDTNLSGKERAVVMGRNPNGLSFSCGVAALVLFAWITTGRWRKFSKIFFVSVGFLLLILLVVKTGSRGGALSLLAGLCVYPAFSLQKGRAPKMIFALALMIGGLVYIGVENSVLVDRLQASWQGDDLGGRPELAKASMQLAEQHPIVGVGPAYMRKLAAIVGWDGGGRAAHNTYLQILLSFGYLGLIPFILFLFLTGYRVWKNRKAGEGILALSMFVMLITFLAVSNGAYGKAVWVLIALILNAGRRNPALKDSVEE